MIRYVRCALALAAWCAALPAAGQATASRPSAADRVAQARAAAEEHYAKVVALYMAADWAGLENEVKLDSRFAIDTSPDRRRDIRYIRDAMAECHPAWWTNCTSPSNVSFTARIWGRDFTANYMPSDMLGVQAPVGIENGRIQLVVSWRPALVNDPKPAVGELAVRHGITRGDIGEMIVWHELGHNYITTFLPLEHVMELYTQHQVLFAHLQEFYADLTSLYHASPRGRRTTLLIRLDELDQDDETDPHGRAALAIGSLVLSHVLADPSKWPSVHLPAQVPQTGAERAAIIYVYEHLAATWTFQEDCALRTLVLNFVRTQGEQVLRSRGTVTLTNRLQFKLAAGEDRELQRRRDEWVVAMIGKAAQAGRTDTVPASQPASAAAGVRTVVRTTDGRTLVIERGRGQPRIAVPE